MAMKETTYIKNKILVEFDIENLDDVNRIRKMNWGEGSELKSLDGYCWSPGCCCIHPVTKTKGVPHCGSFKSYDEDGVKRDFLNETFGI